MVGTTSSIIAAGGGIGVSAPGSDLVLSNQPYNMDPASSCGVGVVNGGANRKLDGYTLNTSATSSAIKAVTVSTPAAATCRQAA